MNVTWTKFQPLFSERLSFRYHILFDSSHLHTGMVPYKYRHWQWQRYTIHTLHITVPIVYCRILNRTTYVVYRYGIYPVYFTLPGIRQLENIRRKQFGRLRASLGPHQTDGSLAVITISYAICKERRMFIPPTTHTHPYIHTQTCVRMQTQMKEQGTKHTRRYGTCECIPATVIGVENPMDMA